MKRINRGRFEQLRDRFEKQEFLAMMIPSILPPPTPWKLFVIAAGVFEMRLSTFLLAVFVGRVIRNLITAHPDHRIRAGDREHSRTIGDPAPGCPAGRAGSTPCPTGLLALADSVETTGQERPTRSRHGVGEASQVTGNPQSTARGKLREQLHGQ